MRKTMVSLIIILLLTWLPLSIYAAEHIPSQYYYAPWRNEYRVDHGGLPAYTFHAMRAHFVSPSNVVFVKDFASYTGIFYFTCNGTYQLQWIDENENVLAQTVEMVTTQIINPPCDSYPEQQGTNDLGASFTDQGGGYYDLDWSPLPGATSYEIWQDGQLIGETTDTEFPLNKPGSVTIVAKDGNGNMIGSSDLQVPTYDGDSWGENEPPNGGGSCSVCDKLSDLLNCPGWGEYMGAWEDLLRSVIPPPPDWNYVADVFVNAFDNYWGEMPDAPTAAEIIQETDTPLPELDLTTGAENLTPTLPPEYNEPIIFDLSDAPVIEIVDESPPFIIFDPLDQFDTIPGQGVTPGDPNNSSGDIINPKTHDGLEEMPKPSSSNGTPIAPKPGGIEYEHMEVPKPKTSNGIIPIPGQN